jgi:hypothetical protein
VEKRTRGSRDQLPQDSLPSCVIGSQVNAPKLHTLCRSPFPVHCFASFPLVFQVNPAALPFAPSDPALALARRERPRGPVSDRVRLANGLGRSHDKMERSF